MNEYWDPRGPIASVLTSREARGAVKLLNKCGVLSIGQLAGMTDAGLVSKIGDSRAKAVMADLSDLGIYLANEATPTELASQIWSQQGRLRRAAKKMSDAKQAILDANGRNADLQRQLAETNEALAASQCDNAELRLKLQNGLAALDAAVGQVRSALA